MTQCAECLKQFTGIQAFDKHRTGPYTRKERRCLTTEEMHMHKFVQNERGLWGFELTDSQRASLSRFKK